MVECRFREDVNDFLATGTPRKDCYTTQGFLSAKLSAIPGCITWYVGPDVRMTWTRRLLRLPAFHWGYEIEMAILGGIK